MKNLLVQTARILVGVLFIFSGFVKLVDPKGFGYKLEEYFSPDVFNLEFLMNSSLELSIFFVILEVLLGIFLLLGVFKKFTLYSLFGLIIFFTFLTFYSAYFNKVTDCGCFGDAIKLTPWESFYKDIILFGLIMILLFGQKFIAPIFPKKVNHAVVAVSFLASCWVVSCGINHLPLIDFRAFAVGNNIQKGMEIPEGAPKDSMQITFIYEYEGKQLEFDQTELANLPKGATYVDRKDVLISEGYKPPIKADFQFDCDGEIRTDEYLNAEKLVVIIVPIVDDLNQDGWTKMKVFAKELQVNNIPIVGAFNDRIEDANFDQCTMDGTMLKTIIRANPGIMVLNKGTVLAKYHYNDIPTSEEIQKLF